jgi:hexosaminidase
MKHLLTPLLLCFLTLCARAGALDDIVPRPAKAEASKGSLRISGASIKCDPAFDAATVEAVGRFAARLGYASGKTSPVSTPPGLRDALAGGKVKGIVFLRDGSLAPEAYSILVSKRNAVVRASGLNGVIYALETLRQLLPPSIYGSRQALKDRWTLPCCLIEDSPRFAWRGMHLDSSRHFWSIDEVKRYLDVMAMYKLNRCHWHLTDDQGWRIEIQAFPLLSQIACWREGTMIGRDFSSDDHIRYGGF